LLHDKWDTKGKLKLSYRFSQEMGDVITLIQLQVYNSVLYQRSSSSPGLADGPSAEGSDGAREQEPMCRTEALV